MAMMNVLKSAFVVFGCLFILAATGCGRSSVPQDTAVVQDVPVDVAADVAVDVAPDVAGDTVSDVGVDVVDVEDDSLDSGVDAGDLVAVDVVPYDVPIDYDASIKFLSFNLRMPYDSEPGKRWDDRKQSLVNVVKDFQPDIMVTQEGYLDPLAFIQGSIDNFVWIGDARNNSPLFDEHCAIFYRTDKFELVETKTVAISDTPDVPGSKINVDDQLYPRIITWGHFKRIADGFEFDVFSTHWDHTGVDGIRQKMAVITLGQMALLSGGRPSFVAGDFNCGFESEPWKIMVGQATFEEVTGSLIDTWIELGLVEEGSFHAFTGIASANRIDWILHTEGLEAVSAGIIKTSFDGVYPSDHFPIGAEFRLVRP
jgi:endonuclease/exonuclease/phosphatase family metal-dependent hydrolase